LHRTEDTTTHTQRQEGAEDEEEAYRGAGARGEELPVEDPGSEVAAAEEARHLSARREVASAVASHEWG